MKKRVFAVIIMIVIVSGILVMAIDREESFIGYVGDYIGQNPYYEYEDEYYTQPFYYGDVYDYNPPYHDNYHIESGYIYTAPYYYEEDYEEENENIFGNVPDIQTGNGFPLLDFEMTYNYDCECIRACSCYVNYWGSYDSQISGGYIGIMPLTIYADATVTHPNQIQAYVNSMSAHGQRTIYLNFTNNVIDTTDVPPINIHQDRYIILESANGVNQVWNRNQMSGRHITIGSPSPNGWVGSTLDIIGRLELRNVTLSRCIDWVAQNPTVVSGGVQVQGANIPAGIPLAENPLPIRHSHLIMNHQNATISNNRAAGTGGSSGAAAGGGIGMTTGARVTIYNGNIINNVSQGHGGGIYSDGLQENLAAHRTLITIHGGRISGNRALMGGGGIGMCCNTEVRFNNGVIYENTAYGVGTGFSQGGGGGVHLGTWAAAGGTNNRLYMTDGAINDNETHASGGGVYAPAVNRIFYMYGGAIYNNEALGTGSTQGGGGVFPAATGTFIFNGGLIGGRWDGGNRIPAGNIAQRGGGVMLPAGVRLEMRGTPDSTIIMSNHAHLHGGGIYVTGETIAGVPSVIMEGGTIGGNGNHGNTAGLSGGGVFVGLYADFAMKAGSVNGTATVGNIIGNSAPIGGGINAQGGLTLDAGNIRANKANANNQGEYGLGGGFHVSTTGAILNFEGTGTMNIENNTARLGGGFYWLYGTLNVDLNTGPINIRNNEAVDGAGVWIGGNGVMPITANMNVYNNVATGNGGGVFVGLDAEVLMTDPTARIGHNNPDYGNVAIRGGGIHVEGTLTMQAGRIVGNHAIGITNTTGLGGGIHIGANANVNMEGPGTINIEHNTARHGGGLHWSQGTFTLASGSPGNINIRHNTAIEGGGIWMGANGALTLTGSLQLYQNTAQYGGGIFLGGSSTLTLTGNAQIYNNITTQQGGAVFVNTNAHLIMNSPNATIGHTNPLLGNSSINGGGVYLLGTFTMHSGNILGNTASANGGGVYIGGSTAVFNMVGPGAKSISGNTAVNGGGVHWAQGSWTVSNNIAISGNTATGNGGGIWLSSSTPFSLGNFMEVYGNTAINGGGILVAGGSTLTLSGGWHIFDNTATQNGGGVFIESGTTLAIPDNQVTIGHATSSLGNTALRGGGVHIEGTLNMQAGNIIGNSATGAATGFGGGIHFGTSTAVLNMTGAANKNISGNSARLGGGVHWSQGTWNLAGNTGNINISSNNASSQGGGIHMTGSRVLTICSRWLINENSATGFGPSSGGGGMWIGGVGTSLTVNGGVITKNAANCSMNITQGGLGGGVHVFGGAVMNMINGEVSHNTAHAMGGGIMAQRDLAAAGIAFTMSGGTINDNFARNGGGGITIGVTGSNNTYATMTGGEILYNEASHGGGVWLMHGILNMYDGRIDENKAGIGVGSHPSNRHGGGGGVMVCCTSRLYLHDGQINGNTGRVGGGVYLAHSASAMPGILSYFIMLGGEVDENTATIDRFLDSNNNFYGPADLEFDGDGGGVFITSTGYFILEGSDPKSISGNTAENSGGGVRWVTGYWYTADNTSTVQFIGNTAAEDGGGIYIGGGMFVGGVFTPGHLVTHGTWTINENEATRGGGVFVGGGYFLDSNNDPVYFASTFDLTYGGIVAYNTATEDGAGIFLYDGVNFNQTHNTTIRNNIASRNGGGVFVSPNADFTMVGGTIGGGTSFITNPNASSDLTISPQANRAQRGAGVYLSSGANFTMEQGTAIVSGSPITTTGSILGNYASQGGGGVAVVDDSDDDVLFTLRAGLIQGNVTPGTGTGVLPSVVSGAGVLVAGETARFEMEGGTINNNSNPAWSGAGVTVMGESEMLMTGGSITKNYCRTSGGGGVAVRHYATFTMDGGTISGNSGTVGGGVLAYNRGLFVMKNGLITSNIIRGGTPGNPMGGNMGGGGLGVAGNATAIMEGGTITNHTLRNNLDDGGGVWVANVGAAVGGGFHFPGVSTFIMEGGSITNNTARRGGGIFLDGIGEIEDGLINNNTASTVTGGYVAGTGPWHGSGGGIYVTNTGTLEAEEVSITNNHAHSMGGGIFTERHQYYVFTLTLATAYDNLDMDNTVIFSGNTAAMGAFTPPTNAYAWTGIPGLAQGGTQSIHNHPINNHDINFRRAAPIPFVFHKANQSVIGNTTFVDIEDIEPYLLAGAQFSLLRFSGVGTPPDVAVVGSPDWTVVYNNISSTGLLATPISMGLSPGGIYHLVEVQAPAGFMIPFGQWRITTNNAAPGGFVVTPIGTMIPDFEYLDGYFYVGNRIDIQLPMTGHTGINTRVMIAGAAGVFAAIVTIGFVLYGKSNKKSYKPSS